MTLAEFHERVCEPPLAQVRKKGALPLCCCVLTHSLSLSLSVPFISAIFVPLCLSPALLLSAFAGCLKILLCRGRLWSQRRMVCLLWQSCSHGFKALLSQSCVGHEQSLLRHVGKLLEALLSQLLSGMLTRSELQFSEAKLHGTLPASLHPKHRHA